MTAESCKKKLMWFLHGRSGETAATPQRFKMTYELNCIVQTVSAVLSSSAINNTLTLSHLFCSRLCPLRVQPRGEDGQ